MIRVIASSVIAAPVDKVWNLLRDYNSTPAWLPGVVKSVIEEGGAADRLGSVRSLDLADGSKLREKLLALSDAEYYVTFAIIDTVLPIANYKSTIQLQPLTDGDQSYITWKGEFDVIGDHEEEMRHRMREDIYQASFDTLKKRIAMNQG